MLLEIGGQGSLYSSADFNSRIRNMLHRIRGKTILLALANVDCWHSEGGRFDKTAGRVSNHDFGTLHHRKIIPITKMVDKRCICMFGDIVPNCFQHCFGPLLHARSREYDLVAGKCRQGFQYSADLLGNRGLAIESRWMERDQNDVTRKVNAKFFPDFLGGRDFAIVNLIQATLTDHGDTPVLFPHQAKVSRVISGCRKMQSSDLRMGVSNGIVNDTLSDFTAADVRQRNAMHEGCESDTPEFPAVTEKKQQIIAISLQPAGDQQLGMGQRTYLRGWSGCTVHGIKRNNLDVRAGSEFKFNFVNGFSTRAQEMGTRYQQVDIEAFRGMANDPFQQAKI